MRLVNGSTQGVELHWGSTPGPAGFTEYRGSTPSTVRYRVLPATALRKLLKLKKAYPIESGVPLTALIISAAPTTRPRVAPLVGPKMCQSGFPLSTEQGCNPAQALFEVRMLASCPVTRPGP